MNFPQHPLHLFTRYVVLELGGCIIELLLPLSDLIHSTLVLRGELPHLCGQPSVLHTEPLRFPPLLIETRRELLVGLFRLRNDLFAWCMHRIEVIILDGRCGLSS